MAYLGEIRNTLPVVIDYFSRMRGDNFDPKLRTSTVLNLLAKPPEDLDDRTLRARVRELESKEQNKIDLHKLEKKLPEPSREVFHAFLSGQDLFEIGNSVSKSLSSVFKLMRLIERKLAGRTSTAPVKSLRRKWHSSKMYPKEKLAVEYSLMGFDKYEIASLLGVSPESGVNRKADGLKKMGYREPSFRPLIHQLAMRNISQIEEVYEQRLIDYTFTRAEQKQLGLRLRSDRYKIAVKLLKHYVDRELNEANSNLLKNYLAIREYKASAELAGLSQCTGEENIKTIREKLRDFYYRSYSNKILAPRAEHIPLLDWLLLNPLQQKVLLLYIDGDSLEKILKKIQSDSSLEEYVEPSFRKELTNKAQIQHLIAKTKEQLNLSKERIREIRLERLAERDLDSVELQNKLFSSLFNIEEIKKLGLLGKDREQKKLELLQRIVDLVDNYRGNASSFDFELWSKGLTPSDIAARPGETRTHAQIKEGLRSLKKYLRRSIVQRL